MNETVSEIVKQEIKSEIPYIYILLHGAQLAYLFYCHLFEFVDITRTSVLDLKLSLIYFKHLLH